MIVSRKASRLITNTFKRLFSSNHEYDSAYIGTDLIPEVTSKKLLHIAILGLPNSGKSTLVNQLVRRPVCASSFRMHTTRVSTFAIHNEGNTQLVFVDTPGLTTNREIKKFELGAAFKEGIKESMVQADVIGILQDMQVPQSRKNISKRILEVLPFARENTPFVLILNKVDLLKNKTMLLEVVQNLTESRKITFSDIFMISALKNKGVDDLRNYFLDLAKPNEWKYEENVYTNQAPEEVIERVVRAKMLDNIAQEIPYNTKIEVLHVEFNTAQHLTTIVILHPIRRSHYGLIIGNAGKRIRTIALQAEQELCSIFHTSVTLRLSAVCKDLNIP